MCRGPCRPEPRRIASSIAETDPFPFVPATWMHGTALSGWPSSAERILILSTPNFTPAVLRPNRYSCTAG